MSQLDPLLQRNLRFAESRAFQGVSIMPRIPVFLVTCLDPRVDPAAVLGVELGDVVSVRNAGGRVTDAVIEDVAFIRTTPIPLVAAECGRGIAAAALLLASSEADFITGESLVVGGGWLALSGRQLVDGQSLCSNAAAEWRRGGLAGQGGVPGGTEAWR